MVERFTRPITMAATSVAAVAIILAAQVTELAVAACSKPDPNNTKACYDPTDNVFTCGNIPSPSAATCAAAKMYLLNQFPAGTVESATGGTKTLATDCYKTISCTYDVEEKKCVSGTGSAWFLGNKIIVNPDVVCPSPPPA